MTERRRRGHGEGGVYRRASDGLWVGSLDLGYVDGKRKRRTVYGKTRREALEALNRVRRAAEQGQDLTTPSPTVGQWLDRWMAMKQADGSRPSTLRGYKQIIENHVRPALGSKRLDKITPSDVRALIDAKTASGLSGTTVAHILRLLRNTLNDAERLDLVIRNVARAVKMPKASEPDLHVLTVKDVKALMAASRPHRLFPLFATLMMLGLRRGEALALQWDDIDFANSTVHVQRSLQRVDGRLQIVPVKTPASRAPVIAPRGLIQILKKHRTAQRTQRLSEGPEWQGGDFVFTSVRGTPLEPRNVSRAWADVREDAGLPRVRLHDLRHGYATILTALGVPPRVVMEMLRHANIGITMNVYAGVDLDTQREAAASLDKALFGRRR